MMYKILDISGLDGIKLLVIAVAIIISMYNRIRYLCLKAASLKIAEAEEKTNLTGAEKFSLVVIWIEESLPTIFRMAFARSLIEKLVQYTYDNSNAYAKNYIKRKTGYDISKIVEDYSENNYNASIK